MTKDEQQALDEHWGKIEEQAQDAIVEDPYHGFWLGWQAHQAYVAKRFIDAFLRGGGDDPQPG